MLTAIRRSHIWQPETSLCICAPIILCSDPGSPPQAECVSEMNFAYVWGERREEPGEMREEQHRQEIPLTHMWRRWTCTAAWPSLWPLQECEGTEQMSHYTRRMQFWFSSNSSAGLHQKVFSPEINNWCRCSFSSLWIGHKTKNNDVQKSSQSFISCHQSIIYHNSSSCRDNVHHLVHEWPAVILVTAAFKETISYHSRTEGC